MKLLLLISVLWTTGFCQETNWELSVPRGMNYKYLKLNKTLVTDRMRLNSMNRLVDNLFFEDSTALSHLEVQLKQSFWLVMGYRRFGRNKVRDIWQGFQEKLIGYGCHCWVKNNALGGNGYHQDSLDLACRDQSRCANCIKLDNTVNPMIFNNVACDKHTAYFSQMKKDKATKRRYIMCGDNLNDCERANCECDKSFAEAVAAAVDKDYNGYDPSILNTFNGGVGVCENSNSPMGPANGCCGDYPERRSYWSDAPVNKGCCGNAMNKQSVYDQTSHECCNMNSGRVALAGTCDD